MSQVRGMTPWPTQIIPGLVLGLGRGCMNWSGPLVEVCLLFWWGWDDVLTHMVWDLKSHPIWWGKAELSLLSPRIEYFPTEWEPSWLCPEGIATLVAPLHFFYQNDKDSSWTILLQGAILFPTDMLQNQLQQWNAGDYVQLHGATCLQVTIFLYIKSPRSWKIIVTKINYKKVCNL